MTKLCPRGKAAAKRKFKVYPSAYANAYASKICAGKIKDPSGVKRKDFKGPKPTSASEGEFIKKPQPPLRNKKNFRRFLSPQEIKYQKKKKAYDTLTGNENRPSRPKRMKVGMAVTAGAQSATGRLEKSGIKKMMSGGFGIFSKKKKDKKSSQEENAKKKKKRLEELRKEIGAKEGKMMIMIAVGKPKKTKRTTRSRQGADFNHPRGFRLSDEKFGNPKKAKPKKANKGAIMKVAKGLEKASRTHAGQAKTLKSLKLTKGGGAAIRGMNFKGVY